MTEKRILIFALIGIIILCLLSIDFCNINPEGRELMSIVLTVCVTKIGTMVDWHWGSANKEKD